MFFLANYLDSTPYLQTPEGLLPLPYPDDLSVPGFDIFTDNPLEIHYEG